MGRESTYFEKRRVEKVVTIAITFTGIRYSFGRGFGRGVEEEEQWQLVSTTMAVEEGYRLTL